MTGADLCKKTERAVKAIRGDCGQAHCPSPSFWNAKRNKLNACLGATLREPHLAGHRLGSRFLESAAHARWDHSRPSRPKHQQCGQWLIPPDPEASRCSHPVQHLFLLVLLKNHWKGACRVLVSLWSRSELIDWCRSLQEKRTGGDSHLWKIVARRIVPVQAFGTQK